MADPATHPGQNFEHTMQFDYRDRGWHWYPNVGFWSIGQDGLRAVEGWAPFLLRRGYATLNYSQVEPYGRVSESAAQLRAILEALEEQRTAGTYPQLAGIATRPIVLLGHSRGGILARQVLVDLTGDASPVVRRVRACVTLHTPNQGSGLANAAHVLATSGEAWKVAALLFGVPWPIVAAALVFADDDIDKLQRAAGQVAYREIWLGSALLAALAAREPVPGVKYYTFGGTRPVFWNLRAWEYTPESTMILPHLPPFHWGTLYKIIAPWPPPLPIPELTPGVGDVLVAAPLSRLPYAEHSENSINHAEALWDDALKIQVEAILRQAAIPQALVVSCVNADANDPDRAIDALGGLTPYGEQWRLTLDEAVTISRRGGKFVVVRKADGEEVPVQRVRRRDGRRYLRTKPGAGGPRLADLPPCP